MLRSENLLANLRRFCTDTSVKIMRNAGRQAQITATVHSRCDQYMVGEVSSVRKTVNIHQARRMPLAMDGDICIGRT